MSAIIYEDPTAGLSLVSTRDPHLEQTRYLFFPGNLIDPDRLFELQYMRGTGGGEEVQAHCLRRSVNGFIRKCHLTPLEVWTDRLPPEYIGEGLERETVVIAGEGAPVAKQRRPGFLIGTPLHHVKFYPGDEIKSIQRANTGKGIVEAATLLSFPWYADPEETEPGVPQILNSDFFPTVPQELSKVEEQIDKVSGRSDLHRDVARDMKAACAQFRRFAEATLSAEHVLLRQRVSPNGQHVYVYSPVARELLKQLEMKPQDSLFEQTTGQYEDLVRAMAENRGGLTVENISEVVRAVVLAMNEPAPKKGKAKEPEE